MKSKYATTTCLRRTLVRAVSAGALLLLGWAATGQVTPKSPLGTWDCVMSGPRAGLAQFTFMDDGTFTNYEILVPKPQQVSTIDLNQRNNGGDTGRTGGTGTGSGSTLPPHVNIYGFEATGGPWGFDIRGRVVGYYYETTLPTLTTNTQQLSVSTNISAVPVGESSITNGSEFCVTAPAGTITNTDTSVNYLFTVTCYGNIITATANTNAVSFVGTVVPGKRITLVASTPQGNVTFRGVADAPVADLTGSWYGAKHVGVLWNNEFFTMTPSALGPNMYDVQGGGPAYQYAGTAFFFPQKKLGIALGVYSAFPPPDFTEPAPVTRAVIGPLNARTFGGTLHGGEGANNQTPQQLHFSVQKQ